MPAPTIAVQRHVMSLALLPGVTGRHDLRAGEREQLLAVLRPVLEECLAPGSTVTVFAPALDSRTTTTARPDLGASGYAAPRSPSTPAEQDAEQGDGPGGDRSGDPVPGEPPLHVTASAAVVLVRLAGWAGEVTVHEIGPAGMTPARAVDAEDGVDAVEPAGATHLMVFACASPDGVLPAGASLVLAEAERQTHELCRKVVASVDAAGLAPDLAST